MSAVFLTDPDLTAALAAAGLDSATSLLALWPGESATSLRTEVAMKVAGTCGRLYLKSYRYPGWGKSRGLVGRGSFFGTAPQVQEFRNLSWLRAHDVPAVRPVAAASQRVRGRLAGHALLTEIVPGARDLAAAMADPDDPVRSDRAHRYALAGTLGRAVARMHLHGFSHRDCHARNVLVRDDADGPAIWFLDCRRGGRRGARRGRLFDLACLRIDLRPEEGAVFGAAEWTHLLASYIGAEQGTAELDAAVDPVAEAEASRLARRRARR